MTAEPLLQTDTLAARPLRPVGNVPWRPKLARPLTSARREPRPGIVLACASSGPAKDNSASECSSRIVVTPWGTRVEAIAQDSGRGARRRAGAAAGVVMFSPAVAAQPDCRARARRLQCAARAPHSGGPMSLRALASAFLPLAALLPTARIRAQVPCFDSTLGTNLNLSDDSV